MTREFEREDSWPSICSLSLTPYRNDELEQNHVWKTDPKSDERNIKNAADPWHPIGKPSNILLFYFTYILKVADFISDWVLLVLWIFFVGRYWESAFILLTIILGSYYGCRTHKKKGATKSSLLLRLLGLGSILDGWQVLRNWKNNIGLTEALRVFYISQAGEISFETLLGGSFQIGLLGITTPNFQSPEYCIQFLSGLITIGSYTWNQIQLFQIKGGGNKLLLRIFEDGYPTFYVIVWGLFVSTEMLARIVSISLLWDTMCDRGALELFFIIVILYSIQVLSSRYHMTKGATKRIWEWRFKLLLVSLPGTLSLATIISITRFLPMKKFGGRLLIHIVALTFCIISDSNKSSRVFVTSLIIGILSLLSVGSILVLYKNELEFKAQNNEVSESSIDESDGRLAQTPSALFLKRARKIVMQPVDGREFSSENSSEFVMGCKDSGHVAAASEISECEDRTSVNIMKH